MKRILLGLFFVGIVVLASDVWVFLRTPLSIPQPYTDYVLKPGMGIVSLSQGLSKKGILKRPAYLVGIAFVRGDMFRLKAGEYRLMPGLTPVQLLNQIVEGRMLYYHLALIEGWTFEQILTAIRKQPRLLQTISNLPPEMIMKELGHPGEHPEGRFFPDTYTFMAGATDISILRQSYRLMTKRLAAEWKNRAPGLPYTSSDEALIIASLIEKETAIAAERPKVAAVILNRLQKKMRLQIDPTVIYGLGKNYTGKLRGSDLKFPSPYNTYLNHGLPPTPIAMPSLSSIRAALHPEKTDALYFVAKGDGSHQFSTTLKDHNTAVKSWKMTSAKP